MLKKIKVLLHFAGDQDDFTIDKYNTKKHEEEARRDTKNILYNVNILNTIFSLWFSVVLCVIRFLMKNQKSNIFSPMIAFVRKRPDL